MILEAQNFLKFRWEMLTNAASSYVQTDIFDNVY